MRAAYRLILHSIGMFYRKFNVDHYCRRMVLTCIFFLPGMISSAHNINLALEEAPVKDVAWFYTRLGICHIIPYGLDHILFVTAICLLNKRVQTIIWQATAFTVAHSITLALSMKNVVSLPAAVVEPIIAFSIAFIAVENMLFSELKPWRILIIFFFGLIHGLGFAAALNEIGLPRNQFLLSILSFNLGVELGQLGIILLVYLLMTRPFGEKRYYKKRIVFPVSAIIAVIALYWTVERLFM